MDTVYILKTCSLTKKYYIGFTQDLKQRLIQHNSDQTRSLKNKGPFEVIYTEQFDTFTEARKRELQIKRYNGGSAFKKLVESPSSFGVVV